MGHGIVDEWDADPQFAVVCYYVIVPKRDSYSCRSSRIHGNKYNEHDAECGAHIHADIRQHIHSHWLVRECRHDGGKHAGVGV